MAIELTLGASSGFPGIFDAWSDPTGGGLGEYRLYSVYDEGATFTQVINIIDVPPPVAEGMPEEEPRTFTVELLSSTMGQPTISFTVDEEASTGTFVGRAQDSFPDQYYQFIMPDKSLKILPKTTTEDFLAIVRWNPPNTKIITISHTFKLKITYTDILGGEEELTFTYLQDVYWVWQPALAAFRDFVNKGKI